MDHLFLDQDGVPTLVEVKRSSDTRLRREVVGQMLDYAANAVVYWPIEHLKAQFERQCEKRGTAPEDALAGFLGPESDSSAFWQQAKTNLQAGRVRMVFVADEIPSELRRIIEFLNAQMDPAEVLGVEIRQFEGQNLKTLVPTVLGQTAEAMQRKGTSTEEVRQWDEESFFEDFARKGPPGDLVTARRILEWSKREVSRVWWGKGRTYASFVPQFEFDGGKHQLFNVWASGRIELYFYWYAYKPPFDDQQKRLELLRRLNEIPGISLPSTMIGGKPSIPLSILAEEMQLQAFLNCFRWFMDEIRTSGAG